MSQLNRRSFVQLGAISSALGLLGSRLNALAPFAPAGEKMLVIFARGANDALNAFPPHGDGQYAVQRRTGTAPNSGGSNVYIDPSTSTTAPVRSVAIDGGNFSTSYVEAHPALASLVPLITSDQSRCAVLGRVGNPTGLRSHFTEMAIMETGRPRVGFPPLEREGWGAKLAGTSSASGLKAVSHSTRLQRILLSTDPAVSIPAVNRVYDDAGAFAYGVDDFFGHVNVGTAKAKDNLVGTSTTGLTGHATQAVQAAWSAERRFAHDAHRGFVAAKAELEGLTGFSHRGDLFPVTAAERAQYAPNLPAYGPGEQFLRQVEEAMFVLQNTGSLISAVDFGGFDTHNNQLFDQNRLLAYVAQALVGADMRAQLDPSNNYLILFITEFGRTNKSNGGGGTDHGIGTTWLAVGDKIRAGVYNMGDPNNIPVGFGAPWELLNSAASLAINAIPVATDFRTIFAEILQTKFRLSNNVIDNAILRHAFTGTMGTGQTARLNFLR